MLTEPLGSGLFWLSRGTSRSRCTIFLLSKPMRIASLSSTKRLSRFVIMQLLDNSTVNRQVQ